MCRIDGDKAQKKCSEWYSFPSTYLKDCDGMWCHLSEEFSMSIEESSHHNFANSMNEEQNVGK